MKKYFLKRLSVAKMSFLEIMAFRISIFSIFISTVFVLFLSYFLWTGIYSQNNVLETYSLKEMITYILFANLMNAVLNTPRRVPLNISSEVRSGKVAHKLIKPLTYYEYNFWYCFGRGLYFFLVITLPLGIITFFILDVVPPLDWVNLVAFIVSFFLGFLVEIGISMLLAGVIFWTVQSNGILRVNGFFAYLFSGRLIPLVFFPLWLSKIAYMLPYHSVVSIPIRIYLGKGYLGMQLATQLFWVLVLLTVGNWLFKKAYNRLEVVGG
ncbi:MAG: ABC-2 family transporter protein [Halanaerobiales bacterium]|nr:ABC-2 family transporter protein [Halanaerobiales bacterium]